MISSFTHELFRSVLFSFKMFVDFPNFFMFFNFLFNFIMIAEHHLCDFCPYKYRDLLSDLGYMVHFGEVSICSWEEWLFLLLWTECSKDVSWSSWIIVFKSSIALLLFCLFLCSLAAGMLKFPSIVNSVTLASGVCKLCCWMHVLVSCGCCNKWPEIWWLKTQKIMPAQF